MPDQIDRNQEIEARFLVRGAKWRGRGTPVEIYQGYLSTQKDKVMRIRIQGNKPILTVKGLTQGLIKKEFEFMLDDVQKAKEVIRTFCPHPIRKIRHKIQHGEFLWEVDEYKGDNEGLVIAEVEFTHEEDFATMLEKGKPEWVGKNITAGHWQYTNMMLAERPYTHWNDKDKKDMLQHASEKVDACQ